MADEPKPKESLLDAVYGNLADAVGGSSVADDIAVESFSVPGMLQDKYGNKWTIPADDITAEEMLVDPLKLPHGLGPEWYGQYERKDRASQRIADGFVPVRREEVGAEELVFRSDYGHPQSPYHEVGDLVYMKMPKVLEERRRRTQDKLSRAAVESITDPQVRPEALGGANRLARDGSARRLAEAQEPTEAEAHRQQFMPRFDKHK